VILSDLAKYSMTRSVARSLCDSWASYCSRGRHCLWRTNKNCYLSQARPYTQCLSGSADYGF